MFLTPDLFFDSFQVFILRPSEADSLNHDLHQTREHRFFHGHSALLHNDPHMDRATHNGPGPVQNSLGDVTVSLSANEPSV